MTDQTATLRDAVRRIAGRVTREDGEGVSGAEVRIDAGIGQREFRVVHPADASGRFLIAGFLPRSQYYAWARTDTLLSELFGPDNLSDEGKSDLALTIVESATVAGMVVDSEGNPAPGVGVSASPEKWINIGMVMRLATELRRAAVVLKVESSTGRGCRVRSAGEWLSSPVRSV